MFISADKQPSAQGKVLDMAAVHSLLTQAVSQMESLSRQHQQQKHSHRIPATSRR
jgi:hypothetical protein